MLNILNKLFNKDKTTQVASSETADTCDCGHECMCGNNHCECEHESPENMTEAANETNEHACMCGNDSCGCEEDNEESCGCGCC